jgi:2,3-diketo-5-methylthio-1-phosphopentane phosphatase/HAD superfamily hydrolase (TIGR01509 family)
MKQLILCDFDGTITLQDMGYLLLNRFSKGDWETIDREFREEKIGSKEAYSRIVKILHGEKEAVLDFLREHSQIDSSFPSFYRYCREREIDVKIVSDGLDFYIKTILEIHHLEKIPYYANEGHFLKPKGMGIGFPHFNEECGHCGTCKKKLVQMHRKDYDSIFFVGNGLSDRCGAREADFVFAKDSLYTYCIDQDVACHFYEGFQDILNDLKKRIRGIIFDLDGTLIEAYEAIHIGLNEALRAYGKEVVPFSDQKKYLKADLEATLSVFFSPEEIPKVIPIMRKKYEEVYLDKTHFLDGAEEILETLHSTGVLLGVASNKFGRFSRGALSHLGVAHLFRAIVGAGDVARNKPFPDMLHSVLNAMDLPAENVVFVGDTLTDIETGKQAGVDVYALPTGYDPKKELARGRPKRILRNLKEIVHRVEHPFS